LVCIVGNKEYTSEEYEQRKKQDPDFDKGRLQTRVRNPNVYVCGYVRHEDHAERENFMSSQYDNVLFSQFRNVLF